MAAKDRIAAAVILVFTFAVFRLSPLHAVADSRYEMLFSQQLLWKHTFGLDGSAFPELRSRKPGQIHRRGVDLSYQLQQVGERFYYLFPPGSTILSMPYVAVANAVGISAVDGEGAYDPRGDKWIQAGLAALLMAGLSVGTFLTSRMILSFGWSLLITASTAFGTQVWSTASRVMWIQTWGIFILTIVIGLIVRAEVRHSRPPPVLLATCLSWCYFVRPTFSISIVAVAVYVLIYHRSTFIALAATGAAWLAAFMAYSYFNFGQILPLYYQFQGVAFRFQKSFWEGLAGTLVSPARGLLVYVPIVLFVCYLLIRYRSDLRRHLAAMAIAIICVHIVMISGYLPWHGGHCYGPRYTTDVVPWLALLGILAVEARLRWRNSNPAQDSLLRVRTEWSVALVLLVCSVTLNGIGAISISATEWNALPSNIDEDHARLWDWRHPPFFGVPDKSAIRLPNPGG